MFSVSAVCAQTGGIVEVIAGTTAECLGSASTDSFPAPVMFREVHLRLQLPRGGQINGELILAHAALSNQFWWILQNTRDSETTFDSAKWFAAHAAVFVATDKILLFRQVQPTDIWIHERRGLTAWNLEEAQRKAIMDIRSHLAEIEKGGLARGLGGVTTAQIGRQIPFDLYLHPGNAQYNSGIISIISAAREGRGWKLIVRARWDQEIILDQSFGFVSTRRLPASPPQ